MPPAAAGRDLHQHDTQTEVYTVQLGASGIASPGSTEVKSDKVGQGG